MARNVYEYGRGGKCICMSGYTYAGIRIKNMRRTPTSSAPALRCTTAASRVSRPTSSSTSTHTRTCCARASKRRARSYHGYRCGVVVMAWRVSSWWCWSKSWPGFTGHAASGGAAIQWAPPLDRTRVRGDLTRGVSMIQTVSIGECHRHCSIWFAPATNEGYKALFLATLRFCVHYCIDRDTVQKKKTALRAVFLSWCPQQTWKWFGNKQQTNKCTW